MMDFIDELRKSRWALESTTEKLRCRKDMMKQSGKRDELVEEVAVLDSIISQVFRLEQKHLERNK